MTITRGTTARQGLIILFSLLIVSCSQNDGKVQIESNIESKKYGLLEKDSIHYLMEIEATDGVDSIVVIKFRIDNRIVDSLKLSESKISSICKTAATYGDWDVKNKRTYRFNTKRKSLVYFSDDSIIAAIEGIAANSYGVEDNVSTLIYFDINGNILKEGEYNTPKIWTH